MKRYLAGIILFTSCGGPIDSAPNTIELSTLPIRTPAVATETAVRIPVEPSTTVEVPTLPPETTEAPVPYYAPEGLSDCDEMHWYRVDAGLPERFDALGWRESNCRNEDGVKTYCCYGYWQLYTSLHLRDHRLAPKMHACGVYGADDLNSDTPEDKKRQACAAKALYDVVGYSAWSI